MALLVTIWFIYVNILGSIAEGMLSLQMSKSENNLSFD